MRRGLAVALAGLLVACGAESGSETEPAPRPSPEVSAPAAKAPPAAMAPSFDCSRAEGSIQELICADAELAALDLRLDSVFRAATEVATGFGDAPAALVELRTFQRGWIGGRDECWKAEDPRECAVTEYRNRIALLQASFRLVQGSEPVFWRCADNPADEFVTTFFPTDPPTAEVERGDAVERLVRTGPEPDSPYGGPFGVSLSVLGDQAVFQWPEGTVLRCRRRDPAAG